MCFIPWGLGKLGFACTLFSGETSKQTKVHGVDLIINDFNVTSYPHPQFEKKYVAIIENG